MNRTELTELTVLCLLEQGNAILLQNRVKKDWRGWTLPGGHVEPGESIVEAVVREMREETGLTILRPHLCGIKQFPIEGGRYLVFLFKACRFNGTLRASKEGSVAWIERSRLPELTTVADFAELLDVFDRDDLTEFQYIIHDERWEALLK